MDLKKKKKKNYPAKENGSRERPSYRTHTLKY